MKSFQTGSVTIEWLGHAGFVLKDREHVVYIDPYKVPPYVGHDLQADLLLITHEHHDHCSPQSITKVRKSTATTLIPESCNLEFRGDARRIDAGDILHDELSIKGLNIEVVPAYNIEKSNHPKGMGVGYIVEIGGKRIYHAGDTDLIEEMKKIDADVALLPIAGYGMDEKAASEAVSWIRPEVVIPMHYGTLEGMDGDLDLFISLVKEKAQDVEVVILENIVEG
ncbi:L-ascorbate metabolism protein UlaG (beta-lactamase superfamily) [Methanohalophilus levihalophilus]|uniref:MBL fold metallo-hydrolase n=1 Tax=Methanohalophilus levihalophilus TaxID=1431282 RepID=UPI001AE87872|nr:MBL fold metallo-hydrolase [Methanohalophilus levihalophilus]MBP2030729.1 L-ascorbate metabolism protein UlaG (beta-lactamase superfamily) [Methanohalophilus levihalophilus]